MKNRLKSKRRKTSSNANEDKDYIIFAVTGRPRMPRDQGSVENANKFVKMIIGSILVERRLAGENPNWTEILGSVMSKINSQHGRGKNDVSVYSHKLS